MNQLPLAARLYVIGIIASASALLAVFGAVPTWGELPIFLGLGLGMVLAAALKLRLPTTKNRATMSMSFVIDFASLLLLGPHKTMLIAAIGGISQSTVRVEHRNPLHRILFNVASLVITVEAAGAMYGLFGGTVAPLGWPQSATAIVAGVCSYFMVNSGAIAVAIALSTYQPVRREIGRAHV